MIYGNTPVDAHHDDNSLNPRGEIAERDIPPLQENRQADSVLMEPEIVPATKVSLDKSCIGDKSSDVYYYELHDNNPGLCCKAKDGSITWSPIKMIQHSIRAACSDSCDEADVIPPSNCASIFFEWKDSVTIYLALKLREKRMISKVFGFLLIKIKEPLHN